MPFFDLQAPDLYTIYLNTRLDKLLFLLNFLFLITVLKSVALIHVPFYLIINLHFLEMYFVIKKKTKK